MRHIYGRARWLAGPQRPWAAVGQYGPAVVVAVGMMQHLNQSTTQPTARTDPAPTSTPPQHHIQATTQMTPSRPPPPPVPGCALLAAAAAGPDGHYDDFEREELLGPHSPKSAASSPSSPPASATQQIRWDRIVTAALGVMALTSLLFVATDSSSLLYFTPTPATDAAVRIRTGEPGGQQGASTRPSSFYTTLSYKEDDVTAGRRHGRRRPRPPCNYTLLSGDPEGTRWEPGFQGPLGPVHAACSVRAFEGEEGNAEAVRCLQGKHLVFLGDSLSRYQYLSLVHFLETKSWDEQQTQGSNEMGNDSAVNRTITWREGWGGDWNDIYRSTSQSLGGHEVCDCFRSGHAPWAENRYYHLQPHDGAGADDDSVRVSFIGWFGGGGPRGHSLPPGGLANLTQEALGCPAGGCKGPHHWKDSAAGFLQGSFLREQLRPDVLLLNTGLWKTIEEGQLQTLVSAAKSLTATTPIDVYWKTTTSRAIGATWVNDTAPRQAFLAAGLKVFDASAFTLQLRSHSELYQDGTTHYTPEVYRGLNRLLLNELCPPGSS